MSTINDPPVATEPTPDEPPEKRKIHLGTKILIGVVVVIAWIVVGNHGGSGTKHHNTAAPAAASASTHGSKAKAKSSPPGPAARLRYQAIAAVGADSLVSATFGERSYNAAGITGYAGIVTWKIDENLTEHMTAEDAQFDTIHLLEAAAKARISKMRTFELVGKLPTVDRLGNTHMSTVLDILYTHRLWDRVGPALSTGQVWKLGDIHFINMYLREAGDQ